MQRQKRLLDFLGSILALALLMATSMASAQEPLLKAWSFGVTYAGAGIGYRFSPRWSTEVRAQAASNNVLGGMRENFHFKPRWGIYPYLGIEADYVSFDGSATKGSGYAAEAFLGAEYYFASVWSAVLDVGPAWISLKDKDTDETVDGVEGVINLGINYHFGKAIQ